MTRANSNRAAQKLRPRAFFARFRRNIAGNVLAIMAAALIPLTGMVGGAIDISRMYIIKTRMQHACDAGALAGRKQMGGGVWGTDDNAVALKFYDANFPANGYGSTGTTRSFSESGGTVTGTVTANVPMTLMRILGAPTQALTVTCDSEMRLPNTDVMFVLDVTGSMNCPAASTTCTNNNGVPASGSKIDGLKTAVKCFYEIVARLKTNATCATTNATGGTGNQVQIRFGFMPYASNVNVGTSLPTSYFANSWNYQSRKYVSSAWGPWTQNSYSNSSQNGSCSVAYADTATTQYKVDKTSSTNRYGTSYYCVQSSRTLVDTWHYGTIPLNISSLKGGSGWNAGVTAPLGAGGSNITLQWDGCIQERPTVATTNYTPIPSNAYDLNIDLVPNSSTASSLWGPSLPDAIYGRNFTSINNTNSATTTESDYAGDYYNNFADYCPTAAQKLQTWSDPTSFDTYVDSLVAQGNTYHDIGMLWGARFMSPTGIFASENAKTLPNGSYSGGADIQRHMIFMTDGDSTSSPCDYNAYGVPFYDQKQTTDVGPASQCASNRQALIDQINLRLAALCTSVKNMNITLWVISFGNGTNTDTEARLQACATSPSYYFKATNSAALQTQFATIANNISALRLTK